ncbi:Hypothetical predicted protein [Octopus vulgaris]|uniref:Uncharacterized protein n=1 Tax=Octopus vulgaris TaxID=6645 RepID=A0AA36ARD8_OCTVU|nr:Hypothetical predicted protein [Octopus vulgaris]
MDTSGKFVHHIHLTIITKNEVKPICTAHHSMKYTVHNEIHQDKKQCRMSINFNCAPFFHSYLQISTSRLTEVKM